MLRVQILAAEMNRRLAGQHSPGPATSLCAAVIRDPDVVHQARPFPQSAKPSAARMNRPSPGCMPDLEDAASSSRASPRELMTAHEATGKQDREEPRHDPAAPDASSR
jgi:hypothetical protein